MSLYADDAAVMPPTGERIVGKEKVADTVRGFLERGAEFKVLKTVVLGPLVLNERDDTIVTAANGPARTFHVAAGLFFIENGRIVEWTDYVIQ